MSAVIDAEGTLSEIVVYPLKSAGGVSLTEAVVDRWGLRHDRRFLVVDPEGVFLTQRELPRLALITPKLQEKTLVLNAPGMDGLTLPLTSPDPPTRTVRVWGDTTLAIPLGRAADDWVSTFLGAPCSLVRFSDAAPRTVDPTYARPDDQVGFADGFPFLLIGEGSLGDLNGRLDEPLPINRFRPNLVVRGTPPYAEDAWHEVAVGEVTFRVVKPCARCSITTVEQTTGQVGKEPLRTLARYRRVGGKVMFGQNLIHDRPGTLRVGDPVRVGRSAVRG